jgi:HNH endonuclease
VNAMKTAENASEWLLGHVLVNPLTGCWEWTGSRDRDGYGRTWASGKRRSVHRVSYEMTYGPIPAGLQIDHLCRVRHCANPAHMETVTPRVNTLRGKTVPAANAAKTHCINGHEFTPENTRIYRGWRCCRACHRARYAGTYGARKAGR